MALAHLSFCRRFCICWLDSDSNCLLGLLAASCRTPRASGPGLVVGRLIQRPSWLGGLADSSGWCSGTRGPCCLLRWCLVDMASLPLLNCFNNYFCYYYRPTAAESGAPGPDSTASR
jgi:hypothetical protein